MIKLFRFRFFPVKARLSILFLHIPKTAGTSFRRSVEQTTKIESVADYGKNSSKTTKWFIKAANKGERWLGEKLKKHTAFMLTGHFRCGKYSKFFYPYQISAFIREPTERILSDFYFKKRQNHVNFAEMSIETFVERRSFQNLQAKFLGELAPEYYGLIGLSDDYSASLDCFNHLFGLNLKQVSANQNPDRKTDQYQISDDLKQRILELNQDDYVLYEKVRAIFKIRQAMIGLSNHILYGAFTMTETAIIGRAYRAYSEESVNLEIRLNGEKIGEVEANQLNPIPADVKQPRNGMIGFEFSINEWDIKETDQVTVGTKISEEILIYTDRL